jgi:hypothetical protein
MPALARRYRQYPPGQYAQVGPEGNLESHSNAGDHGGPLQIYLEPMYEQTHVLKQSMYFAHRHFEKAYELYHV